MSSLLEIVDYKKSIFRVADDIQKFRGAPKSIIDTEVELIKKVDIVFATAKPLVERIKQTRSDVVYLPNGVDYEKFANADLIEPEEYSEIKGPKIVYVGAISDWFDIDLIYDVATKLSHYNFILIGPLGISLSKLSGMKNVFILGPRKYESISAYMKYADVGIIPFLRNKLVDSISPIKLFEYFACGLPVVATHMKEAESMNPPCYFADTHEEFLVLLQEAYHKGKNMPEFFKFAEANSWKARFEMVRELITEENCA